VFSEYSLCLHCLLVLVLSAVRKLSWLGGLQVLVAALAASGLRQGEKKRKVLRK